MTTTQFEAQPEQIKKRPNGSRDQSARDARKALRPLPVDLGIPLGSYYILRAAGCDLVMSLVLSSVVPVVRSVAGLVKDRTVNALAALMVAVNVVSIAISFWSGDPRIMLAKDGAVSSTIGIAILVSLFTARPLMTAGLRPFIVKGDAAKAPVFDRLASRSAPSATRCTGSFTRPGWPDSGWPPSPDSAWSRSGCAGAPPGSGPPTCCWSFWPASRWP